MARYTHGPSDAVRKFPRFEYKASSPHHTGGGYPRVRSWEWREHTAKRSKEDVFVPIHRLCAVAWLFPDGWTAEDILDSGHLSNADVHHGLGMPAANVDSNSPNFGDGEGLQIRSHGGHSSITQAQMRAWAEDDRQQATEPSTDTECCDRCGESASILARSADWDGTYCLPCSKDASDGATIQVV